MDSHFRNIDTTTSAAGYASKQYAQSLDEFGTVRQLPSCGGWLLKTEIPDSESFDGMGCYPLFCCEDWTALGNDLTSLADELVSVRIVTDPFAEVSISQLQQTFPDVCREFKQHFVTDLSQPLESIVASHHRRNVRKSLGAVTVRQISGTQELLSAWLGLYDNLIQRHGINGIARFSPMSFGRQMNAPGCTAFSAYDGDETCGMTLWYVSGGVAYYHLGAYSDRGYELGASFALFWSALSHFRETGIRWAALGAGAGLNSAESGLARFKSGWATHTRPVYFCGRILQPAAYAKLVAHAATPANFFPAYRAA